MLFFHYLDKRIKLYADQLKNEALKKMKICPVCKGVGKLPVTQVPKAESDGEETLGKCPTCNGKGKIEDNEDESN